MESDYSTFKARLKGSNWSVKELDAFTEVTNELVTANYRKFQQEAPHLLTVNPVSPSQTIQPTLASKSTPAMAKPFVNQSQSTPIEPKSSNNGKEQADDF